MALFGSRKRGLFDPPVTYGTPGIGDGRNEDMRDILPSPMDRPEMKRRPQGFWQGGEKFGVRDGLAGLLAVVGDAFANQAGMEPGAVRNLAGGRLSAIEKARKEQEQAQAHQQAIAKLRMAMPNINDAQADAIINNHASAGDFQPKAPPAMQQNYQWWEGLPEEKKRRFEQYQGVVNPWRFKGEDGLPYNGAGGDSDWEVVPGPGGGAGNGAGGFPRRR